MVIKPFITLCWPPIYFLVKIKISVTICRGPNGPTPDYLWNDLSLPASSLHLLLNRTLHLLSSKAELAAAHHSRPYSSAAPCPSEEVWIIYKSIRQGLFFPSLLCYNTNSIYPGGRHLVHDRPHSPVRRICCWRAAKPQGDPRTCALSKPGEVQYLGDGCIL